MLARISIVVQSILAIAIFYLGYSIFQFSNKISEVIDVYPQMLSDVSQVTEQLEIEEWLLFAEQVESLAPQVIQTVDGINRALLEVNGTVASVDQKIPLVLAEFSEYRESVIPSVVNEASNYREQVIPPTLAELKLYRTDVVPPMLVESKGYRTLVPTVITESEQVRAELPALLAKIDLILDKSQDIASEATQGAVKGVVLSPINLLRDASTELKSKVIEVEE
ncbi:hypothetical protein [Vibrio mexicanus]|uniref:hypothetical protein n=1 Tax=Vibrio mexicanus TaxID=1004326 RepID=UPI00063CADCA|nr:hypothetical protein [Vibrio mexicanus]